MMMLAKALKNMPEKDLSKKKSNSEGKDCYHLNLTPLGGPSTGKLNTLHNLQHKKKLLQSKTHVRKVHSNITY